MKHSFLKTYFVCPECNEPLDEASELLEESLQHKLNYCTMCGKYIASAYKEALAEIKQRANQSEQI